MANKKASKGQAAVEESDEVFEAVPVEEQDQAPGLMKRVRVDRTEEFEEPVQALPLSDEQAPIIAEPAPPPLSDAELLMQQAATDSEYLLRVDHLPNFSDDGRTDTQAAREFCCNFSPVPLDVLDKIQRRYGGGDYLLTMFRRGDSRGFVKRWYESLKQPIEQPAAEAPPFVQPQSNTAGELDTAINVLEKLDRLASGRRRLVGEGTANTPQANEKPKTLLEQVQEMTLLKNGMKELMGDEGNSKTEPSAGWLRDVGYVAEAIGVKEILKPVGHILMAALAQRGAPVNPNGQQQPAQLNEPAIELSEEEKAAQRTQLAEQTYARLLLLVADDLKKNRNVGRAQCTIEDFAAQFPEYQEQIAQLVNEQPESILALLAGMTNQPDLVTYSHAVDFITDLQEALRGEDEPEGEEVKE